MISQAYAGMGFRVLICDPDDAFADQAHRLLVAQEHDVLAAGRLDQALEVASQWQPDVVMLSSELADSKETDAVRQLRRLVPRPALLLTGTMERFDAVWRVWQRGCDEVLFRPILSSAELQNMVVATVESVRSGERTLLAEHRPRAIA